MKKSLFFVFFILFALDVYALGIGVVPDRLVFDGGDEKAVILNPNNVTIDFKIKNQYITCEPSEGIIGPGGSSAVVCRAAEGAKDTVILVETTGSGGSVGVIPAVAIKAEMDWKGEADTLGREGDKEGEGEEGEEETGEGEEKEKEGADEVEQTESRTPLAISGENNTNENSAREEKAPGLMQEMKPEMISIAFLTAAILFVLGYSEVKKKKKEQRKKESAKEEPSESTAASSRPASQDDQSSA